MLLVVTSETGNLYEFATPKFSKVLETFKGWYRSSAKDAKRLEVAICLFFRPCMAVSFLCETQHLPQLCVPSALEVALSVT